MIHRLSDLTSMSLFHDMRIGMGSLLDILICFGYSYLIFINLYFFFSVF